MVPTKTVGYPKEKIGYSFYNPPENKVFVARNVEFFKNDLIDQEASGSLEDLKIIQEEDTHPSINTSLHHNEYDQEINEPQSDIIPIPNYKAALLDLESNKWLNAMNVEMQSIRDNEVWDLVDLHPNGKTVGASTPAGKQRMQNIPYALAVESIMYVVRCTRPDVAFAQNTTSRFQQNLGGDMKRELGVSCYTDAGYMSDADDMKSQTGYVFILSGGVVDWKRTKQSIFATSSTNVEYITAFDASNEAVWIHIHLWA
ncbi:hypothetical protein Tco_1536476 [Tanacetum coccineum]